MTPALIAFSLLAAPVSPADAYTLRLDARAVDTACAVFTEPERALLDAAIRRSRDDAVLQGAAPARLDAYEADHDAGAEILCTGAADRASVRAHLDEVATLSSYTELAFEGRRQSWVARRTGGGARPVWRLSQALGDGAARFGVFEHDGELSLALALRAPAAPVTAIAYWRDAEEEPIPVDLTYDGLLPPPGGDPLSSWGAPVDREQRAFAAGRLSETRAAALAPASGAPAFGFAFPQSMIASLTALEPREGVRIELRDASGAASTMIWVEVGALNAALAFLTLPEPEPDTAAEPVTP